MTMRGAKCLVTVNNLTSASQPHRHRICQKKLLLCCIGLNLLASATAKDSSLPGRESKRQKAAPELITDDEIHDISDGASTPGTSAGGRSFLRKHGERELEQASAITGFVLINADTNEKIWDFADGNVIDLSSLSTSNFNIKALTQGLIEYVDFEFNGYYSHTEKAAPYALCGDNGGDYQKCNELKEGEFTVTAIPTPGSPLTIAFSMELSTTTTTTRQEIHRNEELTTPGTSAPATSAPATSTPATSTTATSTPATSTTATSTAATSMCSIPQFVGGWIEGNPKYPLGLAETQGAMIGNDFVIVSGFHKNFGGTTKKVFKLDTTQFSPTWIEQDEIPSSEGISHTGFVVVGQKYYICNGFLGGHPGPATDECFVFDNTAARGWQWSPLPLLPEPRGGGGLAYIEQKNALLFAGGAVRKSGDWFDFHDAWILELDDFATGWVRTADIPFATNHLSAVTARDSSGASRIYFMGGQKGHDEGDSEIDDIYEFVYSPHGMDQWVKRANMPITRGHASSSTVKYGCGFIISGGTQRGNGQVKDISYYDPLADEWTKIGDLPKNVNTPVCDISLDVNGDDWLYCETGKFGGYSYKRKINTGWVQQG